MKKSKIPMFVVTFIFLFFISLSSCKIPIDVKQNFSEVDFTEPQKVQVSFNEHIYDVTIAFIDTEIEMKIVNEKDLLNGTDVSICDGKYILKYKDMVFKGDVSNLSVSFMPYIISAFLNSFEEKIYLDLYDEDKGCYYVKRDINDYFIIFEAYKTDKETFYCMEIK